ncbi:MAG: methyltransferase domain-containing protein [Armatimonadota bacterium]
MQEDSFRLIAPFYDELMAQVPYDEWVEYFRLILTLNNAKPKTLLDVCCGTGTMAEMFAKLGFTVHGFDLSEPMIEVAQARAISTGLPISFEVADAAKVKLAGKFDAAYSFFDSLNYLTSPELLDSAIKNVAKHLNPGALFVFDLNTEYAFVKQMFDQQDMRKKAKLRYDWKGDYDHEARQIAVTMDFWWEGEHVQVVQRQRAHPLDEVRDMLLEAGFKPVRVYHSYTLDRPRKSSDRVHFVARLPE